jgi:hypothetical protein
MCIFALHTIVVLSSDISLEPVSSALGRVAIVHSRYGQSVNYTNNSNMGPTCSQIKEEMEVRGWMFANLIITYIIAK